jgi:hypothetical protein
MSFIDKIGRKARSVFYIIFISGLLSLTSFIVGLVWNYSFTAHLNFSEITFLESVGIVSFVYIIYFGIKFGEASWLNDTHSANKSDSNIQHDIMTEKHNSTTRNEKCINRDSFSRLPDDEKKELQELVSKCCGIPVENNSTQSSFRRRI